MRAVLPAALVLACAMTAASAQQLYRWVDKDGGVHYTQQPPPPDAKNVQRRAVAPPPPEPDNLPYATQLAARNYPVSLFTTEDCGTACKTGRELLEKRGIPFKEFPVGDEKSMDELKRVSPKLQVPVLRIGAQITIGFEPEGWKAALDAAGYPASGPRVRPQVVQPVLKDLPPVRLFTNPDCGDLCEQARSLLATRGVVFQETAVTAENAESLEELKRISGTDAVPVLLVGARMQRGFDPAFYHTLLDQAGFPKAPPRPAAGAAKR